MEWRVEELSSFAAASPEWDRVACAADSPSPFLSHIWHQVVQELAEENACPPPRPYLIGDGQGARALLTLGAMQVLWRGGLVPSRVRVLNETGRAQIDQIGLEHNGLLSASSEEEANGFRALLEHLLLQDRQWDELQVNWVDAERWAGLSVALQGLPLAAVVEERKPYYSIDLAGIRDVEDYLVRLGSNTRYQVRRALRLYGGREALQVEVAPDQRTAQAWLARLIELHQAHWQTRGRAGAFAAPLMRSFHRRLVELSGVSGTAELIRVTGPQGEIGYLYNLCSGSYICNYQSGFRYCGDPRKKPGLVCHALAITEAALRERRCYDLLVGDSRYKRNLADQRGEMLRVRVQRQRWRLCFEQWARCQWARCQWARE